MTLLTAVGALAIGLSLGLLGSGGSILTVPVLVYLAGQDEKAAIAGSLGIVGAIALTGGAAAAFRRGVHWRSVLWFGPPGMAGTALGAWLARFVSGELQLTVFAGVMLAAAALMLRPPRGLAGGSGVPARRPVAKIAAEGVGVGVLTGFVGVGGGFLIVPALVLMGGLPIHLAAGTSLLIIAMNAFTGFAGYLDALGDAGRTLDWPVVLSVTGVGIVGSLVGRRVAGKLPQKRLRTLFALFLIVIGTLVLWQYAPGVLGKDGA